MILSGSKRSATSRAKRRMTRMGISAPRYQRGRGSFRGLRGFLAIPLFYPARQRQRAKNGEPNVAALLKKIEQQKQLRFAHTDQSSIRNPGIRPKSRRLRVSKTILFAKATAAIFKSCVPTFSRNARSC